MKCLRYLWFHCCDHSPWWHPHILLCLVNATLKILTWRPENVNGNQRYTRISGCLDQIYGRELAVTKSLNFNFMFSLLTYFHLNGTYQKPVCLCNCLRFKVTGKMCPFLNLFQGDDAPAVPNMAESPVDTDPADVTEVRVWHKSGN